MNASYVVCEGMRRGIWRPLKQVLLVCALGISAGLGTSAIATVPTALHFRDVLAATDIAIGEVEAIYQDSEGYIWLGGRNALLRYNGYEFVTILAETSFEGAVQASPLGHILEVIEDTDQQLWVASHFGLYKYNRQRERLEWCCGHQAADSPFVGLISALANMANGNLVVGGVTGLFVRDYHSGEFEHFSTEGEGFYAMPDNRVNDIYVSRDQRIWVGLDEGLYYIDYQDKTHGFIRPDPHHPELVLNNSVKTLAEDHDGNLWFGTDYGVYRLNLKTKALKRYLHDPNDARSLPDNISRQLFVDHLNTVWIGTDRGGLCIYDKTDDAFTRYQHDEANPFSISSNTTRRIYEDRQGDVWVGTYPSGVNFFDRSTQSILHLAKKQTLATGLIKNQVESIEADEQGNLWIGAGGITYFDTQQHTFKHYYPEGKGNLFQPSSSIINGVVDHEGVLWTGSWGHGVLRYDVDNDRFEKLPTDTTAQKRSITSSELLNDNMIWSVYEDRQHRLWMGTHFNGLTRFDRDSKQFTFYYPNESDPAAITNSVTWGAYEDSKNRLWVGTSRGLNLLNEQETGFKTYHANASDPHSLVDDSILSIYEDKQGRVWFGSDKGLHLYNEERDNFSVYGERDGFADQGIRAIEEDAIGNLWLGTNNGLIQFNADTSYIRNFTRFSGKPIGGVATGAVTKLPNGNIAFGTNSGAYIINPAMLEAVPPPSDVVLTMLRLFTQPVQIGDDTGLLTQSLEHTSHITLNHRQDMLSIEFAALTYREPERVEYAYLLDGFDDRWRKVGHKREAVYTNLPAGKYIFRVKASYGGKIWGEEAPPLQITIRPAPWRSVWAYALYCLVAMAIVGFLINYYRAKAAMQQVIASKLEREVTKRTAELEHKHRELEDAYKKLEGISHSDPLTGLFNRRYIYNLVNLDAKKINRLFKDAELAPHLHKMDLGFFLIDIDHFKSVNDQYGHAVGDQLLVNVANGLRKTCRDSDIICRWGGEEFLVVARFMNRKTALETAERIRRDIASVDVLLNNEERLQKTCSIGFSCFPFIREQVDALGWEQVLDLADKALYAAKYSGRNMSVGLSATSSTNAEAVASLQANNIERLLLEGQLKVLCHHPSLIWRSM